MQELKKEPGSEMSFLDHLDEVRKRLIKSVIIVVLAFLLCWLVADKIYNFLAIPIREALSEASRRELPVEGLTGDEKVLPITAAKEGDKGRFVFNEATKLGESVITPGTSVAATVAVDANGNPGLFTDEPIFTRLTRSFRKA